MSNASLLVPAYVKTCLLLCRMGDRIGLTESYEKAALVKRRRRNGEGTTKDGYEQLERSLKLSGLPLRPDQVMVASKTLLVMAAIAGSLTTAAVTLMMGSDWMVLSAIAAMLLPLLSWHVLVSFPEKRSSRIANDILRSSSETANLMIMSLRHEPSISKAIAFASSSKGRFSAELRRCAWGVIMGRFESFEEALMSLGQRWSTFSEELKASLNAMVTASREATEDGRRRALDRASSTMIAGAKRRIEDYAASLGMPTMLIFGLGILLPLMVGSFMPILSWDLWSGGGVGQGPRNQGDSGSLVQMVSVMNLLFPAIALLVAANSVAGHPMQRNNARGRYSKKRLTAGLAIASGSSIALATASFLLLSGVARPIALLLSATAPVALLLVTFGRTARVCLDLEKEYEDELFRTGARMLEGENFESSLHKASAATQEREASLARRASFSETVIVGRSRDGEAIPGAYGESNARQGIRITRLAAAKDEVAAGMLAMDLAAYLRDLRELDSALKTRLKPTISMMKATALVLAPVVLGITFSIYLTLGSMVGGGGTGSSSSAFLLVLGVFLAEMDAIVVYFISGVAGGSRSETFAFTLGSYLLASEAVFTATAFMASR